MAPERRVQSSLAKAGSNLVVGLPTPQPPNQNYADDNDEQNSQLYRGNAFRRLPEPNVMSAEGLI
jgi:hypothetical protein